ncbi:MAG: efflux RND transporter periplasmic adaptor subunit [bacterium]|nr:efflux RND transporter periplasmic adaptor subunit [bacterium]
MKSTGLMLSVLVLMSAGCGKREVEKAAAPDARPRVKTVKAVQRTFSDGLHVQGTVRVKNSAVISARVPGTIDEVFVEEGARVTNGAALFRVDRVNLENAVAQAQAAHAAAAAVVGEVEAAIEKAKWDDERMARLFEGKAVTRDAFEKARLQKKTVAAKLEAVRAQLAQAEAAERSAGKNLADSVVRAPFAGVVTRKHKNAGDYVAPGVPVFAMDDPSVCELCVSLAAVHYPKVEVGKTGLSLLDGGGTNRLVVSYKAPRVDPQTRTFEVRCVLPPSHLSQPIPGMIRDARVEFSAGEAQAVPEASVGMRGGRSVVFAVRGGKVVSIPVEIGVRTEGWVEVKSPALAEEEIVSEGMLLLNEGEEVRRVSE